MPSPRPFRAFALAACLLGGCLPAVTLLPPAPAPLREPPPVPASFAETWDAAIDHLAREGVPIRTIERASGIIVAEEMAVDSVRGLAYADCGHVAGAPAAASPWGPGVPARGGRRPIAAGRGFYNILVRGDSARSTVLVTVRWRTLERPLGSGDPADRIAPIECSTRGVWERETEAAVRDRARATATRRPARRSGR